MQGMTLPLQPEGGQTMCMRILRTVIVLTLSLASMSVYAQKVTYDWDKDVDFTPYRTYKWVDDLPGKSPVETTHKRILSIVDFQLLAKNLEESKDEMQICT